MLHLIQWKNICKSYHYFIPSIIHSKLNQSSYIHIYISKLYIASSQPIHPPPLDSSTFSPNPDAQKSINPPQSGLRTSLRWHAAHYCTTLQNGNGHLSSLQLKVVAMVKEICSQAATNMVFQDLKANKVLQNNLQGNSSHGHLQDLLFHLNTTRKDSSKSLEPSVKIVIGFCQLFRRFLADLWGS